MSFFGPSQAQSAQALQAMTTELEAMTDAFDRMVNSCHKKCISAHYADVELNKGESVCVDRCIPKFLEVQLKVSKKFMDVGKQAMEQEQAAGSA